MASVKRRIEKIKQPRGGYLPKNFFETYVFDDSRTLAPQENINPSHIASVVDYLTRWKTGVPLEDAFKVPLLGAAHFDYVHKIHSHPSSQLESAGKLLSEISDLDDQSITNACKLTGYDVIYRTGLIPSPTPLHNIQPDPNTISNIRIMVERSLHFWDTYGPITHIGFEFPESAFTPYITAAELDYMTADTIWDFKVLSKEPTATDSLQLLVYYIMGHHSHLPQFKNITKLGIFNPRKNKVYLAEISSIPQKTIDEVSAIVVGCKQP